MAAEEPFLEDIPGCYYQDTHYLLINPKQIDGIVDLESNIIHESRAPEQSPKNVAQEEKKSEPNSSIESIKKNVYNSHDGARQKKQSAELVVCIHGIGSYYNHYQHLIPILSSFGYQVLVYDLIGRGFSKMPSNIIREDGTSIFDSRGHINQLRELLTGLNLTQKKYHLIGHSMGGALATLYTIQYPSEIASLTLLSPAGLMNLPVIKIIHRCSCLHGFFRYILQNNQEKAWKDDFQDLSNPIVIESITNLQQIYSNKHFEGFWNSLLSFPLINLDEMVMKLGQQHQIPIFLTWARSDRAVPFQPSFQRWQGIFQQSNHPQVQYKIYEEGAHGFFIEFHEMVNQDILTFIQKTAVENRE